MHTPLKPLKCRCQPPQCILIPGSDTNRYVILADSQTQHTLRHHHLNHVSIPRSFIYSLVLHLHTEISISLSFRVKSLGSIENTKQSFDCTSAHIRNPAAPPLGLLCQLRWLSKKNKWESKEVYKEEANRKRSGDVLEDTLLLGGGGHEPEVDYLLNKHMHPPQYACG